MESNKHNVLALASVVLAAKLVDRRLATRKLLHLYDSTNLTQNELRLAIDHILSILPAEYKQRWNGVQYFEMLEREMRAETQKQFNLGKEEWSRCIREGEKYEPFSL